MRFFFPSDWRIEDGDPPSYPLEGDLQDLAGLNLQLSNVWSSVVHDVAERLGTQADPLPLSIDWSLVRSRIVEGLRHTGFSRYLKWFGAARHREERKKRPAVSNKIHRPLKRSRTA